MQVRGLKLNENTWEAIPHYVAPCVGAWIETGQKEKTVSVRPVAPCVGAWIETSFCNFP